MATRQAILDAARALFAQKGFFATTVDEIAARARVAPATVYAVGGGKRGLLAELIRIWTTDPEIEATLNDVGRLTDPAEIIQRVAAGVRQGRENFGDLMRVLLTTAPHDPEAEVQLREVTQQYRGSFEPVARRLQDIGALRSEFDITGAVDLLWFYFGYASLFTLHYDNGWSYDRAQSWLAMQAYHQLVAPGRSPRP